MCDLEKEILPLLRENAELWRLAHPHLAANDSCKVTVEELTQLVAEREVEKQFLIFQNRELRQKISGGAS